MDTLSSLMDICSLNDTAWSTFFLREADRFSGSQEIHYILWNPKVRYRIPF